MDARPDLRDLLQFPCDYLVKAFGPSEPDGQFADRVQAAVSRVLPLARDAMRVRRSGRETYVCVTAVVRLENFAQLSAVYAQLRQIDGLRYLL
jgi:hypothetical protein